MAMLRKVPFPVMPFKFCHSFPKISPTVQKASKLAGTWFKTILFGDWSSSKREAGASGGCPVNMDVITGMGICVYKEL